MEYGRFSRFAVKSSATIAFFACAAAPVAFADTAPNGPQGGIVYDVVSDATAGVAYVSTPTAIYRSSDDGHSWARLPYGIKSDSPMVLFADSQTTYAVGLDCVSLFRSTDHGQTWVPTGYVSADYACITAITTTLPPGRRLLIGNQLGEVLASDDDGASFLPLANGLPGNSTGQSVNMLASSPDQPGLALVVVNQQTYRSLDAGMSWTLVDPSFGHPQGRLKFGSGGVVYRSGLGFHLSRSNDGGASWTTCSSLPTTDQSIAVDAQAGNALYFIDYELGRLHVSNDDCQSAADLDDGFALDGQAKPYAMGVAAQSGDVWLATDVGVYRRSGTQWVPRNDGLKSMPIRSFWADPNTNGRVFTGFADGLYTSTGIYRSDDAGASWSVSNHGLFATSIRALTGDPTTVSNPATTVIYAAGTASWDDDEGVTHAGLWKSSDGGATWGLIEDGIPSGSFGPYLNVVRALALDPRSCAAPPPAPAPCTQGPLQTLYAISDGDWSSGFHSYHYRIIKSQDSGMHWTDIDGLPATIPGQNGASVTPVALVVDPQNPQRLYVGTAYSAIGSAPAIESGVFRSDDGGASWTLMSEGLPLAAGSTNTHDSVYALNIDPDHPSTLWAATLAANNGFLATSRIYKSVDAGLSWVESDAGITAGDIRQITVDRRTSPPTLYAAALNQGIYRSRDGGTTWRSISIGLPLSGASATAIDPHDPARVYVGTSMGAYILDQQLDADEDGVPDEIEQVGPGGGDANGDGIADSTQANVAVIALPTDTMHAHDHGASASGASSGFAVVEVIADGVGTCAQIVDAQSIDLRDRPLDVDHGVAYAHEPPPIRFEVLDCPSATIKLIYTDAAFDAATRLRFLGPTAPSGSDIQWRPMPAQEQDSKTWVFHLAAGQYGSWRPEAAGSVLFEGGPADSERIFRDGFDGVGE